MQRRTERPTGKAILIFLGVFLLACVTVAVSPAHAEEFRPITKTRAALHYVLVSNDASFHAEMSISETILPHSERLKLDDSAAVHLTDKYVQLISPVEWSKWRLLRKLLRMNGERKNIVLFRAFLEDAQPEEQITLMGAGGKMFFPRKLAGNPTANGLYHIINPGGFSQSGQAGEIKSRCIFGPPIIYLQRLKLSRSMTTLCFWAK